MELKITWMENEEDVVIKEEKVFLPEGGHDAPPDNAYQHQRASQGA
jgi:hypothetical protein